MKSVLILYYDPMPYDESACLFPGDIRALKLITKYKYLDLLTLHNGTSMNAGVVFNALNL